MPHVAKTDVLMGASPPVKEGDVIPETYRDMTGQEQPVDFDRLIELGAAEKVSAAEAKKAAASSDDDEE